MFQEKSAHKSPWNKEHKFECFCTFSQILCDPMDSSLPDFSVHGIFQARILEWVALPSSRGIFLSQGLNLGLLHCRQILNHWATREAPWILLVDLYSKFEDSSCHRYWELGGLGRISGTHNLWNEESIWGTRPMFMFINDLRMNTFLN